MAETRKGQHRSFPRTERRNPVLGSLGESGDVDDEEGTRKQKFVNLQETVDQYVLTCMEQETPPRVFELARFLEVSRNRLIAIFKRALGMPPSRYLKQKQVEAAKQLLSTTNLPADKIAYLVGFGTRRTIFRIFRRSVGGTPTQFRRWVQNVSRQGNEDQVNWGPSRPRSAPKGKPKRS